jgi:hypothetical protein
MFAPRKNIFLCALMHAAPPSDYSLIATFFVLSRSILHGSLTPTLAMLLYEEQNGRNDTEVIEESLFYNTGSSTKSRYYTTFYSTHSSRNKLGEIEQAR